MGPGMTGKTEGTVVLEGLLEGKAPSLHDIEGNLRQWVAFAASRGLTFNLEIDGNSVSILAENAAASSAELGAEPSERIAEVLDRLLDIFPPADVPRLTSTIRSREYREGLEVQTLYAVGPDGRIHTRRRQVDAETTPPPRPLTRKQKIRLAAMGLGVAALVFAVSAIFVDYQALFRDIVSRVMPFDLDGLTVESDAFGPYFTVEKKEVIRGGRTVVLTVKRTAAFPLDDESLNRLAAKPGDALSNRLAVEAVARGYVRCEFFDKDGRFQGSTMERIAGLRSRQTIELKLPIPSDRRLARIVVRY